MRINFAFVFIAYCTFLTAQYESGVSYPDSSFKIIEDLALPEVKYASTIKAEDMKKHLNIIASDMMGGRELGTKENTQAAQYLADQLKAIGYEPWSEKKDYFQKVVFSQAIWDSSEVKVGEKNFRYLWDYVSFASESGDLDFNQEEIIFLGYGIHDNRYSDYRSDEVKGKTILIYEGEPIRKDSTYCISKTNKPSFWADTNNKLKVAARMGVKNVLIIKNEFKDFLANNRRKAVGAITVLGPIEENKSGPNHIFISSTLAQAIIGKKRKKVIKAREKINATGKPNSVSINSELDMNFQRKINFTEGYNVFAYLGGKNKADEVIVVSAHYDHVGRRGDLVFNGADDNGSGTTTVLELAEAYKIASKNGHAPERSIMFTWFTGEEKGLLGSLYYTDNPVLPLDNTVANVNIDMVGRIDDRYVDNPDYIYVIGSDRISPRLHEINEEANRDFTQVILDYKYNDEEDKNRFYYRSDHYNFAKNGIPSIFYFNGIHADYHRATDTVDKINFQKMEKIGKLIFHTIWDIANDPVSVRAFMRDTSSETNP